MTVEELGYETPEQVQWAMPGDMPPAGAIIPGAVWRGFNYAVANTIEDFAVSNAFIRALMGPFGSGKTSACITEVVRRARDQAPGADKKRHSRWAIVRNTYSELKMTTMNSVFMWLPEGYCGRHYVADHKYVLNRMADLDAELIFLALDRPDDIKKLLSLELTGAYINEAREVPWTIIEALQGRVGRFPAKGDGGCTWSGIFMDTNPPDTESEFYEFFEGGKWRKDFAKLVEEGVVPRDATPENYAALFKQPDGLGPNAENLENLNGGRMYYVRLAAGKSDEFVKVYCRGDYGFVLEGKLVFPDYNDRIHCQRVEPIPGVPVLRGWDFGLTPACIFSQVLPDGRWLIFDEMCATNMGIDRFSDEVVEHCNQSFPRDVRFKDYGDPAGLQRAQTDERTCFEILIAKGIEIDTGEQTMAIRLESVRKPMRTQMGETTQFILHPRCTTLRKGFQGGYHYRRLHVTGERYSDEPNKNRFSHPMDAMQYVATRLFASALTHRPEEDEDFPDHTGAGDAHLRNETTGY